MIIKLPPKLGKVVLVILPIALFILFSPVHLHAADPIDVGGSNYAWYNINESVINNNGDQNCRENFGIIANYHQQHVRSTVRQQLTAMFDNGQRRLRVPIFHATDLSTGTVLRSTGGNLQPQDRENLTSFLTDIRTAGFQEILVGFFPISQSSPKNWYREFGTSNPAVKTWFYNSSAMQENWNLIRNLRPIIVNVGIDYKIDLRNEGAAASNQPIDRQYASDLWSLYNSSFGKNDTVGFSVATGSIAESTNPDPNVRGNLAVDRYTVMSQVYAETGYGAPLVWDFHAYDFLNSKISKVDAAMTAVGDNTDIIIGETFYQDTTTRSAIQNLNTSRDILAVYAWPVTTARGCDGHVDIAFPEEYIYAPRQLAQTQTPVAEQPVVTVPPIIGEALEAEEQTANTAQSVPVCASAAADTDGDGWGWENNATCIVMESVLSERSTDSITPDRILPTCMLSTSDPDGDGWGWENNRSCVVEQ